MIRIKAIALIHLSNVLFAATALLLALPLITFDGWFTSFCRFAVGLLFGLGQLAVTRTPLRVTRWRPWLGRAVFGALAMTLYFISIDLGSPARASLFNNSFPLFVALIAIFILRERVSLKTVIGLVLSFAGVIMVRYDGTPGTLIADLAGLASGILAGVSYHFNKEAARTEHPVVIYLGVCGFGIILNLFSLPQALQLTLLASLILAGAALAAYWAQITLTMGLRDLPTTEGSIHTFMKIPLTALAAWLLLDDRLNLAFIGGTALLILGLSLNQGAKRQTTSDPEQRSQHD